MICIGHDNFCHFLGRIEGDRAWQGGNDYIFNAFVHCLLSLQGNECTKGADNHLNVILLPRCTAEKGKTGILLVDF